MHETSSNREIRQFIVVETVILETYSNPARFAKGPTSFFITLSPQLNPMPIPSALS
jgi:hypothetical protein